MVISLIHGCCVFDWILMLIRLYFILCLYVFTSQLRQVLSWDELTGKMLLYVDFPSLILCQLYFCFWDKKRLCKYLPRLLYTFTAQTKRSCPKSIWTHISSSRSDDLYKWDFSSSLFMVYVSCHSPSVITLTLPYTAAYWTIGAVTGLSTSKHMISFQKQSIHQVLPYQA